MFGYIKQINGAASWPNTQLGSRSRKNPRPMKHCDQVRQKQLTISLAWTAPSVNYPLIRTQINYTFIILNLQHIAHISYASTHISHAPKTPLVYINKDPPTHKYYCFRNIDFICLINGAYKKWYNKLLSKLLHRK